MPSLTADSWAEMLSGEHQNVRPASVEGTELIQLASRNLLPNPALDGVKANGTPEALKITSHPRPDGWNAYVRQLTQIGSGGQHNTLRDTRLMRQNPAKLGLDEPHYRINAPLIPGPQPPDKEEQSSIAPPYGGDAPVVRVRQRNGNEGYPAGDARILLFYIVGNNPMVSNRYTSGGPSTLITLSQGDQVQVFLPEEVPAGVTGIGIAMTRPGNTDVTTATIQKRVDIRREVPSEVIMRGPYQGGRPRVYPAGVDQANAGGDTTRVAGYALYEDVHRWVGNGNARMEDIDTRLSYQLRTPEGWSAAQTPTPRIRLSGGKFRALTFKPPASAKRAEGVMGWRPLFLADDGQWYAIKEKADYYPLNRAAKLYTTDTRAGKVKKTKQKGKVVEALWIGWKGQGKPQKLGGLTRKDNSGIQPPDAAPEDPVPFAGGGSAQSMAPGRYSVRLTYTEDESQSPPTAPSVVTLRDSGLAAGQAASGTSDQIIEIKRPTPQRVTNARFVERSPDGDFELNWSRPAVPGVQVTTADAKLIVDDNSLASAISDVQLAEPVDIYAERAYRLRMKLSTTRYNSGAFGVEVRFLDENGVGIPSGRKRIATIAHAGEEWVSVQLAPAHIFPSAHVHIPDGATQVQLIFLTIGGTTNTPGVRDHRTVVTNIGLWWGPAHARKRWPLGLGLYSDTDIVDRRSPDVEDDAKPYPPGSYHRLVTDPDPRYVAHRLVGEDAVLGRQTFEDGVIGPQWAAFASSGAEVFVSEAAAIQQTRGLKVRATDSAQAFLYSDAFTGRAQVGLKTLLRVRDLIQTGSGGALWIGASDNGTPLARLDLYANGQLTARARNGASTTAELTALAGVTDPSTLKLELVAKNTGTTSGRVDVLVWKNGTRLPDITFRDLDFTGLTTGQLRVGASNAAGAFGYDIDNIVVTVEGQGETEPLPGNFGEYFASEGTDYDPEVGAIYERMPVEELTTYYLSGYLGCEGVSKDRPWKPFSSVILDEDGNLLQVNGPLVSLSGDNYWDRHVRRIDTPEGAAYIDWLGGGFADGLCRYMALMLEKPEVLTGKNLLAANQSTPTGGDLSNLDATRASLSINESVTINGRPSFEVNTDGTDIGYLHTRPRQTPVDVERDYVASAYIIGQAGREYNLTVVPRDASDFAFPTQNHSITANGAEQRLQVHLNELDPATEELELRVQDNSGTSGVFHVGDLQLEYGSEATEFEIGTQGNPPAPGPTPFTNEHEAEGSFALTFDTALPGAHIVSGHDAVKRLVSGTAKVTHEYSDAEEENADTRVTNVVTEWRTSEDLEVFSQWRYNLLDCPLQRYVQARITLSSTEPTATPGVRGVLCEFERMLPCLLRPDGSEYRSGAWIIADEGSSPQRTVVTRNYRNGSPGIEDLTSEGALDRYTAEVRVWHQDAKYELEDYVPSEEDEGLICEVNGIRRVIRPDGLMPKLEVVQEAHVALAAQNNNIPGWQDEHLRFDLAAATLENAVVLSSEEF